jgi:hypothetical protein
MARGPFFDDALIRYEEVQEANERLIVSLDELRNRADKFLAVAASTATVFAAFANGSHPERSQMDRYQGPTEGNGGPTTIQEPVSSTPTFDPPPPDTTRTSTPTFDPPPPDTTRTSTPTFDPPPPDTTRTSTPTFDPPPPDTTRTSATPWSGPSSAEAVRRQGSEHEGYGHEVVAQAITSPNRTITNAGVPLSFTVTTTGKSVPFLTVKNDLPLQLRFHDNGDGTADIFGTPRKSGIFHFKIRAKFGRGTGKYVVTQGFTLNVVGDS